MRGNVGGISRPVSRVVGPQPTRFDIDNVPRTRYFSYSMVNKTGWDQFLEIILKPDNIPIVGLMFLIFYFTWLAFREARKNDQLIEEGRADEILREMQK